ncbi:MAG: hypothetical protein ACMG6E_04355 [Candidatus Roizmanbacteria bacterium]
MNESVMNALKRDLESPNKKGQNMPQLEINEDHPIVREIILNLKEDYSSRLTMEKDKNKHKEFDYQKEIQ